MKLSQEQIEKIDVILEKLGLDFLDFKLEIKDHIATQTEVLCEQQKISFEEALPKVLKEWEPNLILKSSIWISNKRSFSAIVLNSIRKRYIVYNCITVPIIIGFFIFYFFYRKEFETKSMNNLMFVISTVLIFILSGFRYFISRSNHETSYSYEFNRIYKMALIFWFFDVYIYFISEISSMMLWKAMVITYVPIAIYCYFRHTQFKKSLNIS